jgi:hypothetical protein
MSILVRIADIGAGTARDIVDNVTGGNIPDATTGTDATLRTILAVVFFFAGFVSLIFIIWGGFQYVKSQGDPQATAQAKNTILYAIVGLFIALSAFTIVNITLGAAQP